MASTASFPSRLPLQIRRATIEKSAIDEEKRTVEFSFSSETPVERSYGVEVLSHRKESVDLSRLLDAAPLLDNHLPSEQIGVCERAWVSRGKGYAVARFSENPRASEVFRDIVAGIKRNISVGYQIVEAVRTKEGRGYGLDEFLISKWRPLELSVVALGADPAVGVGRSRQEDFPVRMLDRTNRPMNTDAADTEGTAEQLPAVVEGGIEVVRERTRSDELKRTKLILETARRFNCVELGEQAVRDGIPVAEFEHRVLSDVLHAKPINFDKMQRGIGWGEKERRSYSLLKAIRESLLPGGLTGLEKEASEAVERQLGSTIAHSQRRTLNFGSGSFYMPTDLPMRAGPRVDQRMDVSVTADAGAQFVAEEFLGDQFIAYLRTSLQVRAAGATILDGLQGMIVIPKVVGPTTAYWLGEIDPVTPTDVITSAVSMQPRRLSSMSILSRQLVIQSSLAVEQIVREDIANSIAEQIDATAIWGGTELPLDPNRPTGIFGYTVVPPVPADPTDLIQVITFGPFATDLYTDYVRMVAALDNQNIQNNSRAYIVNPPTWATAMTTPRFPNSSIPVVDNSPTGDSVLGYKYLKTTIIPSAGPYTNRVVFANWKDLLLGFWNGVEIITDPYTSAATAQIRLTSSIFTSLALRYRRSFVVSDNAAGLLAADLSTPAPPPAPREGAGQEGPKRDKK